MSLGAKATHIRCDRIILHFDYDCFYAAVFEAEDARLKSLPLAVQQKQIIVTCNYEARRRGLHKLQRISEARRICPEGKCNVSPAVLDILISFKAIIVLGEDLTRFRNVSKELHKFLTAFVWNGRCERLGFDEAWLDCTDMIDYNVSNLNLYDLEHSFFQLNKDDPSVGFPFDGLATAGERFPTNDTSDQQRGNFFALGPEGADPLELRLRLGSHLASHLRHLIRLEKGYTATVGISVNKLLSKLVGNLHKPDSQTTLLPPYNADQPGTESSVNLFLDSHDIGKIPGIGFKISQKIREYTLGRPAAFHDGLVYGQSKEPVLVGDVRKHSKTSVQAFNNILGGPGWPKDIGRKILDLIHGKDGSEVDVAKQVPTQISIEDSYLRLDTMEEVEREFFKLSKALLRRMRLDLVDMEHEDHSSSLDASSFSFQQGHFEFVSSDQGRLTSTWLAIPRTLRLSTRPRPPRNPDGSRSRSFKRISRSCPFPSFVLANDSPESTTPRLVKETLIPLFQKLHPERSGWDLSLVNLAVTNMQAMASNGRTAEGRDIANMLRAQAVKSNCGTLNPRTHSGTALGEIGQLDMSAYTASEKADIEEGKRYSSEQIHGSEDHLVLTQDSSQVEYSCDSEDDIFQSEADCSLCGASMPTFALEAHSRFHLNPD